jgi:Ca2+-transporting ATPase
MTREHEVDGSAVVGNAHTVTRPLDDGSIKLTIDSEVVMPPFGVSAHILSALVDPKDPDKLRDLGGVKGVAKSLHADIVNGLSVSPMSTFTSGGKEHGETVTLEQRRHAYGANVIPGTPQRSIWSLIWDARHDKILCMLVIAAAVSLAVGIYEDITADASDPYKNLHWIEGASIAVAVLLVVTITACNDYQKEKQFRKLNAKKEDRHIKVIRDGAEQFISIHSILVGDVVLLEPGDLVCADGIVLEAHLLSCDESGATGESDAIKKGPLEHYGFDENIQGSSKINHSAANSRSHLDPFVLSGTKVIEGVGKFLVIAVGRHSMNGRLIMSLQEEKDDTPLQIKLDYLAEKIAKLGAALAITMLLALLIKYIITESLQVGGWKDGFEVFHSFLRIFIQAVTILVVAIPEGLPMAVTIALAYGTSKMLKDNNLVRVLAACETMGNATTVCSDKTGTLTTNVMTVVRATLAQNECPDQHSVKQVYSKLPSPIVEALTQGISVNSTAFESNGEVIGSKTEIALLNMIKSWLLDSNVQRIMGSQTDYQGVRSLAKIAQLFPFSSQRKFMTTIVERNDSLPYRLYCKGASEIVCGFCSSMITSTGDVIPLNNSERAKVSATIQEYANEGLRTIALSFCDYSSEEYNKLFNSGANVDDATPTAPCTGQTLLGIVGIQDPVRPGVPEAVLTCQKAGIFVRMVTGDNVMTASSIARSCNILMRGGIVMEGPEFRKLNDAALTEVIPKLQVLARSSPIDKQILVRKLKEMKEVVAVTGDGTNDGPALKAADVGFSMGITGTEVAKEASSIILMDDNFTSIVKAVSWGRCINDSVRKFLQFQLTVNVTAVVITFISALSDPKGESILNVLQLLWVNLIMDTFAALALATEPPSPDLLDRHPDPPSQPLVTFDMKKIVLGQAFFQILIMCLFIFLGPRMLSLDSEKDAVVIKTIGFNLFVWLQLFNEVNCRVLGSSSLNSFHRFFSNVTFLAVMLFTIVAQVLIIQFGGTVFRTEKLAWYYWLICILLGAISIPWAIVLRLIPDWRTPKPPERIFISEERLQWQATVSDVRHGLSVFQALRRPLNRAASSTVSLSVSAVVPHDVSAAGYE